MKKFKKILLIGGSRPRGKGIGRVGIVIGVLLLVNLVGIRWIDPGTVEVMRHQVFDLYQPLSAAEIGGDASVVIVDIDEASLAAVGHWPWPRTVIGIDVKAATVVGSTLPAWTGWDEAVEAYDRGDYETALHEFRALAEQGDADAQRNLGTMYHEGQGVPQDYTNAVRWFRMASEQGNPPAQFNLGVMYFNGEGVPQENAEAVKWYRKAAEQGFAKAQSNLGVMYANGQGVPQDYIQAHMWFDLAGAQGLESGRNFRESVAKQMNPVQIVEARRLAREWKPRKPN